VALPPRSDFRPWAEQIPVDRLLAELLEQILVQDAPRACALVDSYLERTAERQELMETITYAACHFQNDPHVMRNCTSSVEEFTHNQTSRRDDILRGFVKHQARYVKRADNHDAFNLYAQYFDKTAVAR
jgi:CRISPR/Cas system-associated protein Csm6